MGNSVHGLEKFTVSCGENDKEMVRKVLAWESVPTISPKQLGAKEIFLSLPELALNVYDLVANRRSQQLPGATVFTHPFMRLTLLQQICEIECMLMLLDLC